MFFHIIMIMKVWWKAHLDKVTEVRGNNKYMWGGAHLGVRLKMIVVNVHILMWGVQGVVAANIHNINHVHVVTYWHKQTSKYVNE